MMGTFVLAIAQAAPKLRLEKAAIGTLTIAPGQNGPPQIIEASNAGDGALALTISANVTWINASVGPQRLCTLTRANCTPLNITLNTATLARGKYTGTVTVNDPNAVDAPQSITVTVQIGSGVPNSLDLYLPPNGSTQSSFTTGSNLFTTVTNPANGPAISVASTGGGSFAFAFSYQVTARAPAGTPEGDYRSSIATAGSPLTEDNKTVPVNLHVTAQPITEPAPATVQFRIAQGAATQERFVAFANRGLGTLTLGAITGAADWLKASVVQGTFVDLVADAGALAPGSYSATLTVASNAKNGPASIPVELVVLAPAGPSVYYQRVLEDATFTVGDPVAPGGWVAVFGEQLTVAAPALAQTLPLGTSLGGATVFVNDRAAPIYYVSAGQINFLIPFGTSAGEAAVRVDRDGKRGNTVSVPVVLSSPRLLSLGIGTYANAQINGGRTFPIPVTAGLDSRPATVGDVITFYAFGLGATTPAAADGVGASSSPLALVPGFRIFFGPGNLPRTGVAVVPDFVGLTPGLVGLYQINAVVPEDAPRGDNVIVVLDSGITQSNRVSVAIK
jgi:uncharacterized protein (TIGR03437 family)